MPRLSPSQLASASRIDPLLQLLLPPCRTLTSARNELRWLQEHVRNLASQERLRPGASRKLLDKLCRERARGKPLQYLLGSQPFGDLDILCEKGVLIPRFGSTSK